MATAEVRREMEQVLATLKEDLRTLRPGRASAELVTGLPVACYGSTTPIQQLASITSDERGGLLITPWDKSVIGAIETAVRDSQLGFSVINNGHQLILALPPLTMERREELVRLAKQKGEAARVQIRLVRGEAHQQAVKQKSAGELREDDLARLTKELNEMVDGFNNQIKEIITAKEKELLTS